MSNTKTIMSQASNQYVPPTYIEDVFGTYVEPSGAGTTTVNQGIDLAGEGGMWWGKIRNLGGDPDGRHEIHDTERGAGYYLRTDSTAAQSSFSTNFLTSFTDTGYTGWSGVNGYDVVSWTFRKAPRFFDVVTYTGGSTPQAIAHNLGTTPGMIIIKEYGGTNPWVVYHRSFPSGYGLLNTTDAFSTASAEYVFGDNVTVKAPTDTEFYVGTGGGVNNNNDLYVAYLFAHDPLGPSGDGSDGLIACGSYTGNSSTDGPEIDLGWEPQWVMIKRSSAADNWNLYDTYRGIPTVSGNTLNRLRANTSDAEGTDDHIYVNQTGFKVRTGGSQVNGAGSQYIYIAIRRGPMRVPESGTEVYSTDTWGGGPPAFTSGWPVDMAFTKDVDSGGPEWYWVDRLRGLPSLSSNSTAAETTAGLGTDGNFDFQDGWYNKSSSLPDYRGWMFRRAPNFFDVVAYTGNGVAGHTVPHNLGVAPEFMIVKRRDSTGGWVTYNAASGPTKYQVLNDTFADITFSGIWNDTAPTDTLFTVGDSVGVNASGGKYIAYLFASLDGVSKVGSYTGNGTTQTIDCGFTTGARFVLIKETSGTSAWWTFDSARGITSGADPSLYLNNTNAEDNFDILDADASGFVAKGGVNQSGTSYIFLAIA